MSRFVSSTKGNLLLSPTSCTVNLVGVVSAGRRRAERPDCRFRSRPDGCTSKVEVHDRHPPWGGEYDHGSRFVASTGRGMIHVGASRRGAVVGSPAGRKVCVRGTYSPHPA